MKIIPTLALCATVLAAPLIVRAEGEVTLTDADVQRLLAPTLRSVQVEASSSSGFLSVMLPNGALMRQSLVLPSFTIPVDILPDIQCDIQPMRNAGPPTFVYRDGWFQFQIALRPVSGNIIARTNSFYPNVTAPRVDVGMRFRLESVGGALRTTQFQTTTTGAIDLTGVGSPFSPLVRGRIQSAISSNVEAQLRPRLDLLIALVMPGYLQSATGYGNTLRIGAVIHERDRVLIGVTGRVQRPPIQLLAPDIVYTIPKGTLASILKESNSNVEAETKKVKDSEKAQAEEDKKLSEKYSTGKSADPKGGNGDKGKG
jgi:hypothetical protein